MSSIPAVRGALKGILSSALGGIQVVDGGGVSTLNSQMIFIGRVEGQRSAGSQNRVRTTTRNIPFGTSQDEYTVELIIAVALSGPGETTAALVAADNLFEAARVAIENSDGLGVLGVFEALPSGRFEFDPTSDGNGRYCTVNFGVDIVARD